MPRFLLHVAEVSKRGVFFVIISRHKQNTKIEGFYPVIHFDSLNIHIQIHVHYFIDLNLH